ncbi:hypothetical protein A0H81_13477 [Grifola frondosa]|uniref:Uncharacterized protein n=1 Tax=Grifola frondosa TaxID=5627 RepID=A0A1C7LR51_GRIFR|nr:hypothetical protein A0H81_13477 [Grifola frondosa]
MRSMADVQRDVHIAALQFVGTAVRIMSPRWPYDVMNFMVTVDSELPVTFSVIDPDALIKQYYDETSTVWDEHQGASKTSSGSPPTGQTISPTSSTSVGSSSGLTQSPPASPSAASTSHSHGDI